MRPAAPRRRGDDEGLRLDPNATPRSQPNTTSAEYDQDYLSVVGLDPERLTMIGKARGTEEHQGGTIWQAGDESDPCVTSWLAGKMPTATCIDAKNTTP